ncbi:acyl-CoA thioester hydrolase [Tenacibaculum sp. MAR_2009_124]|uniref:acyl-CoA thioesterase n=1 Tax=Tenacibaculum sp. MAR_2009_124 TaxID=1250059 RepID=UPI00089C05FA|nr:thioesterase family protein [Tenacibaculum sp. MAR_2009_124]SEB38375.1 acyl-CoA thioester hydrolase [Tenacibaculum sp. MAR_2009_124]
MNVYEKTHLVQKSEIDEYNHVNNVVYVQWINDIANEHWKELIKGIKSIDYAWFVVRHEIDYKAQALLNDTVLIKTWVGKTEGVKSVRHVEISRDSQVLVKALTTFCLVDSKTGRPKRITEDVTNLLISKK